MATAYPIPLTAAQIGTYFVGQYYQVLQQQPEIVHQFYSDTSSMLRIDGNIRESANGMLQIHSLVMSISFIGVEIKTIQSLESWNGGVLVMISGSVQQKNFSRSRKFVQTFFLAPQETGFFILNDLFHFIEEDQTHHHPAVILAQSTFPTKLNTAHPTPESVPTYMLGGEMQPREFAPSSDVKENGPVDNYRIVERSQPIPESEGALEGNHPAESNGSAHVVNATPDTPPASVDESVGEPQKHTYASILRVAKGQSGQSVASQPYVNKNFNAASEWDHIPEPTGQQLNAPSSVNEQSGADRTEDVLGAEDEGEVKSVYVRNLPPTVSESEIEEEFEKFGKIRPDGVVIRGRKDLGVCYAFVEFEETDGVHNAVKVASAQIAGRQVYIEERRPNSNIPSRGRRGRGRGSYQTEAPRGRFGSRNFGRGGGHNGTDREYNKPKGNGFYRPSPRQDRGTLVQQISRNGQSLQE